MADCSKTIRSGGGGKMNVVCLLLLVAMLPLCMADADHFKDLPADLFGSSSGFLAAFADFNSDKAVDVFLLIGPGAGGGFQQVNVCLAHLQKFKDWQFEQLTLYKNSSASISSVMPADLNGDEVQDVLLYSQQQKKITILWGNGNYKKNTNGVSLLIDSKNITEVYNVASEPLLFDYDGDRIVDILTQSTNDTTHLEVLKCNSTQNNCSRTIFGNSSKMPAMQSGSFIDVDGDNNPDVIWTTDTHFEMWLWRGKKNWEGPVIREFPPGAKAKEELGQSVFVDFSSTAELNHLVQFNNSIYIWNTNTGRKPFWEMIFNVNDCSNVDGFFNPARNNYKDVTGPKMFLKSADVDQDGYPDFMTIVEFKKQRQIISLLNKKCSPANRCFRGRQLTCSVNPGDFGKHSHVVNLGFFDYRENGKMDVFLTEGDITSNNWTVRALENTFAEDAYFIKVITVSGLCGKYSCKTVGSLIEYGYNQPGPVVEYSITDSQTKSRRSIGAQLYQTGHGSLQLPYILFGIGLSPNFVDTLTVRMPGLNKSHDWTQIIPNSQMLVIPYPIDDPENWENKLFITPSTKMLVTGLTLFGVVIVNVIIIAVLQLMEKKADRIERQQQAHKFNFDAM